MDRRDGLKDDRYYEYYPNWYGTRERLRLQREMKMSAGNNVGGFILILGFMAFITAIFWIPVIIIGFIVVQTAISLKWMKPFSILMYDKPILFNGWFNGKV